MKRTIDETLGDLPAAMRRAGLSADKERLRERALGRAAQGARRARHRWAASAAAFLALVVGVSFALQRWGKGARPGATAHTAHIVNKRYGYSTEDPAGWKVTTLDSGAEVMLLPKTSRSLRSQDGPAVFIRVCRGGGPCLGAESPQMLSATKEPAQLAGVGGMLFRDKMETVTGTRTWTEEHLVVSRDGFSYDIVLSLSLMQPANLPASVTPPDAAYRYVQAHWSWTKPAGVVPGGLPLSGLHMVDPQHGWAQIAGGLEYTDDSGRTLRTVTPPNFSRGATGAYLGPQEAWFAWPASPEAVEVYVAHTKDGGQHWSESAIQDFPWQTPIQTESLSFPDASHGWLLAEFEHGMNSSLGVLFATNDGGKTWRTVAQTMAGGNGSPGILPLGGDVLFTSDQVGFLSGSFASTAPSHLYRTRDGGFSWHEIALPAPKGADHISAMLPFLDPQGDLLEEAYVEDSGDAVTGTALYTSRDGGTHWTLLHLSPASVGWLDPSVGWATPGGALEVTTDGGGTWNLVNDPTLRRVLQNRQIGQVQFVTPEDGWLLATNTQGGVLLRTTDGGTRWSIVAR